MQVDSSEYRSVRASEPLRQGDVLESRDPAVTEMWRRVLLVVTADCDLAHAKHEGRVTCVPILTADEYLLSTTFPRLRASLEKKPIGDLQAVLQRIRSSHPSDERIVDWVRSQELSTISEELRLDGDDLARVTMAHTSIRLFYGEFTKVEEAMNAFLDAQLAAYNPLTRAKAAERIRGAVRDAYQSPPGDVMFLSSISAGSEDGYFACLRHIEQVQESEVVLSTEYREYQYRRISRLTDRFTHALVQRFAMVFLPIGLPREHEESRNLLAMMKVEGLS